MALSMLTACGSSSSTEGTTAVETTTNTTVVSYVQANMSASSGKYVVGSGQAAQTLTGNETSDEKTATSVVKFALGLSTTQPSTGYELLDDVADFANVDFSTAEGETMVYIIAKGDYDTETDLAQEILAKMVARKNDGVYSIATISCFDLTVESNGFWVTAALNGTTLGFDSEEYWVLVVTNAKAKTETDNGYTTGKA